jgi:hypothetical protein
MEKKLFSHTHFKIYKRNRILWLVELFPLTVLSRENSFSAFFERTLLEYCIFFVFLIFAAGFFSPLVDPVLFYLLTVLQFNIFLGNVEKE